MRTAISLALGALGGALMSLAFPPVGFGLFAALGVALITAGCLRGGWARGLAVGALGGFVFFASLMLWLRVVGVDAWLLLSAFCALWFALLGAGTALVARLPGWPVWVAALWTLQEALRDRIPLGGYPWGGLAFSQADAAVGRLAWVGGMPLVTLATALVGTCGLAAVLAARRNPARAGGWLAASVAVLAIGFLVPLSTPSNGSSATIAAIQGGTPGTGLGAMDVRRAVLEGHVRQSELLAERIAQGTAPQPQFVVWPENSTDIDPFADATAAGEISGAAEALGVPVLVGAVVMVPGDPPGLLNTGVVWDPVSGPGARYAKTHPVPFGEYVPFRDLLTRFIGRFDLVPYDFIAGTVPGNLDIAGVPVGDIICFEVAYDEVVQAVIDGGAQVLVVQTNNATYGGTAQPDQQLIIERMRAIETGRWVVVAATSGISAFIDPTGQVVASIGQGDAGSLVQEIPLVETRTPASSAAVPIELALCALGTGAVLLGAVRSRRRRRSVPE